MRKRPVIAIVERHYSRVRGELQAIAEEMVRAGVAGPELEARRAPEVDGHRALLEAIDTCLRLVEPTWTPEHIKPLRQQRRPEMDWGELLHIAYGVIQPSDEALTSAEVLERLWRAGKLTRTQAQSSQFRSKLTNLLRGEEARGAVRAIGQRPARWKVRERSDPKSAQPRRRAEEAGQRLKARRR